MRALFIAMKEKQMQVKNGNTVSVHYKGTLSDGTVFDESRARGKTLNFTVGSGQMIGGFNDAVVGMATGDVKTVTISPEQAYGFHDPGSLQAVEKAAFGEGFEFRTGELVEGNGPRGPFVARIHALEEEKVVLDFNHPLAGEELTFEIELVSSGASTAASTSEWTSSMKKAELLEVAKTRGLSVTTRSTKAQIIDALGA
jgi:peptidylprolyl isomerase